MLADDGEKFGGWPGTKEWVYERGWLDRFMDTMSGLIERGEVELSTLAAALEHVPSGGLLTSRAPHTGRWRGGLCPRCGAPADPAGA